MKKWETFYNKICLFTFLFFCFEFLFKIFPCELFFHLFLDLFNNLDIIIFIYLFIGEVYAPHTSLWCKQNIIFYFPCHNYGLINSLRNKILASLVLWVLYIYICTFSMCFSLFISVSYTLELNIYILDI